MEEQHFWKFYVMTLITMLFGVAFLVGTVLRANDIRELAALSGVMCFIMFTLGGMFLVWTMEEVTMEEV